MKKTVVIIVMLVLVAFSGKAFGGVYDAFSKMGVSSSNYLIENLVTGFETDDYDLFSVCAQRLFDLDIKGSISAFEDIYSEASVDYLSGAPATVAKMRPYFYVTILAFGHFGDDKKAHTLYGILYRFTDDYTTYYVLKALGMMTNSTAALEYLHEAVDWVNTSTLATQLVDSILAHDNISSITYLQELKLNSNISGMKSYINEAISKLSE